MSVATIYDLHGNLPALEAALEEIRQADVDQLLVGGDIVPGPMPRESLELLLSFEKPVRFIQGNGEIDALAVLSGDENQRVPEQYRGMVRWSAGQLAAYEELIAGWDKTLQLAIDGIGEVLFCHATPRDDNEIFTKQTPEELLLPIFANLGVSLVVCGHTHMQFDRMIGNTRVVNSGSAGMPFGKTGADWLLFGPRIEFRHTDYDLAQGTARILQTNYPGADEWVERFLLHPASEAEMLAAYSRARLM